MNAQATDRGPYSEKAIAGLRELIQTLQGPDPEDPEVLPPIVGELMRHRYMKRAKTAKLEEPF